MKKPIFQFGDRVVPSNKAYTSGVFDFNDYGSISGVVVHATPRTDEVRVHQHGRRTATDYHISFWRRLR